jgi:Tol biopolymer transport system component
MTPERWQQVKELFHSALEREPAQRAAFLDLACAGDQELRKEVESLIGSNKNSDSFIEAPGFGAVAQLLAEESPDLSVGQRIGDYKILSLLGSGGMGEVYLAQDSKLGRKVALKLLPVSFTRHHERVHRFEQEARAASALNHPNILTIFDIEEIEGVHFIATEYIEGKTLREHIADRKLELSGALDQVIQVANALAAAHQAGIVHRDIKPENIMVRHDGYLKVLDFGLAKLTEGKAASGEPESQAFTAVKTDTGLVVGTTSYMSPEQAKAQEVDQRSDVFSFGVVFYEMLTGERAFRRDSDVDTLHAIIHEDPPRLAALNRMLPLGVEQVLRRCLEKQPERRYPNGVELVSALEEAVDSLRSIGWVPSSARDPLRRWWQRFRWIAVTCVVLFVAGAAWLLVSRPTPGSGSKRASESAPAVMRTVPFTALPGREWGPSFSPDGSQVAFAWTGEGGDNGDIYVKLVEGGTPQRLTTNPDWDTSPVWSSDGHSIFFTRFSEERRERAIFTIPAIGGPERKLLSTNITLSEASRTRIDSSPDGKFLVYSDAQEGRPRGPFLEIYRLAVESLETSRLTSPPAQMVGDEQPVYSPDGQTLAFVRMSTVGSADLYLMPAGGGEASRLTFDNQLIEGLAWTPDGRSIVFSSRRGGVLGLWRVSPSGGEPERLGVGDNASLPAISRLGQRLAYTTGSGATSIWRVDLPDSPGKTISRIKVLSTTTRDELPQISPDGKRIVFDSTRSGSQEIWVCDSDASNLLQLTKLGRPATGTPRWSPDGRSIAFDTRIEDQSDIYVIAANGGMPRRLTDDPAEDSDPCWSRDGRWIYFQSNRSGEFQVWKMSADGGDAVQVTKHGGVCPFESPDGQFLYYMKVFPLVLWRIPVEGGEEALALDQLRPDYSLWAVAEKGIYFVEREGTGGWVIEFFSFATRGLTRVAAMERPPGFGLAVSPDTRWLLYTQVDVNSTDITLVENFR